MTFAFSGSGSFMMDGKIQIPTRFDDRDFFLDGKDLWNKNQALFLYQLVFKNIFSIKEIEKQYSMPFTMNNAAKLLLSNISLNQRLNEEAFTQGRWQHLSEGVLQKQMDRIRDISPNNYNQVMDKRKRKSNSSQKVGIKK